MTNTVTFLDTVVDENMQPIYNGSTNDTITWLKARNEDGENLKQYSVQPGRERRFYSVDTYLVIYDIEETKG